MDICNDFFWIRLSSAAKLRFSAADGDMERFPDDFIWQWRVHFIDGDERESVASDIIAGIEPLLPFFRRMKAVGRKLKSLTGYDQQGLGPVFDDDFARRVFGTDEHVRFACEIIADIQFKYLVEKLDFFGIERLLAFLEGMIRANLECVNESCHAQFFDGEPRMKRRMIAILDAYRRVHARLSDYCRARYRNSIEKPAIRITSEMRKFSALWPASWETELRSGLLMKDCYGDMRGIINLDTGVESEAIAVMSAIAKKSADRRVLPFELLRLSYPKMPPRNDIEDDIRTILSCYRMRDHPALWAVIRKRGKKYGVACALCRIPRFPDDRGRHAIPKILTLMPKDYGCGKISMQSFWPGARDMAIARMCDKYGFAKSGISFDGNGRQTGPVSCGPMSSRKN